MPGYIPKIDVVIIYSDGTRQPVRNADINVENITTSTVLSDITTDDFGVIAEQSVTGSAGDIIELSSDDYPLTARFTLGATQADAYKGNLSTYIADDLFTTVSDALTGDIYIKDEDADEAPQFLGSGKIGANFFPLQTSIPKNFKVWVVPKSDEFLKTENAFSDANAYDIFVPATRSQFAALFDEKANAATTGTVRETLYGNEVDAGTLFNDGDKIFFRYAGKYAANANGKYVFLKVSNNAIDTDIAESDEQFANGEKWEIDGFIMRVSNTVLRYEAEFTTSGVSPEIREGEITGLNLTNTPVIFNLDARTPTAAGDTTATMATAWFIPAATINYLLGGGVQLLGGGQELYGA